MIKYETNPNFRLSNPKWMIHESKTSNTYVFSPCKPILMYKKITLLICLMAFWVGQVLATYVPVTIASGYNADVVAEGIGLPSATTTTPLDAAGGGANFVFVAEDYQNNATCALPTAPNFLPNSGLLSSPLPGYSGLVFQLASYSGMNCLHLSTQNESGTLTFATPMSAAEVYLLANSGSGVSTLDIVITFTNSDTQQINGLSLADWYGGSNVVIKAARVGRSTTTCGGIEVGTSPSGPNLYQYLLPIKPANYSKQIASIQITKTNVTGTGFPNIMGVSINTPCETPTTQPTALNLIASTAQIDGSFTAATGSVDGYLVVRYNGGDAPTDPVDGTVYAVGTSLGSGTIVSVDASTTFSTTGVFANTTYDFYVYAYNNVDCGGGPMYNLTAPLTGSQTTALCGGPGNITIPVGPLETYTTLTDALNAINTTGISGPVIIELMSGYDGSMEPSYPITFPFNPCISSANNLIIRPAAGVTGLEITSSGANPTILFSGAGNITIDGRPGGVGTLDPGNLKITNTNSSGVAVSFVDDAVNNNLVFLDIQGENTSATSGSNLSGVIYFGEGITTGNDNNTIAFCNIHATNTGYPAIGVSAFGNFSTVASYNDNNTVVNSYIYDIFSPNNQSTGIKLHQGNNAWNIVSNHFYQTAPRTYTSAQNHRAIWVTPNNTGSNTMLEGSGFTITSNYIGGSEPFAGSLPWEMTADAATLGIRFMVMDISVGYGSPTTIAGNIIQNIVVNTGSTSTAGSFCGIFQNAGATNILANVIGASGVPNSIVLNRTGTSTTLGTMIGIRITSGNNLVAGNTVTSMTTASPTSTIGHSISGIDVVGGTSNLITSNTITDLFASNTATTGSQSVNGIAVTGGTNIEITANTISNLTNGHTGTGAASVRGIYITNSQALIQNNEIYNLSNATSSTSSDASAAVVGIYSTTTAGSTIKGNIIHELKTTNTTVASKLTGIYLSGTATADANFIYFLLPGSDNTGVIASGIQINNGNAQTISNNMIHMGYDELGNSITYPTMFRGISRTGTPAGSRILYNSIYIGGSNVDATATTNTFAYHIAGSPNAPDSVLNNIFVNERSNSVPGGGKHYAAYINGSGNTYIDYNIYRANGTDGVMGYNGADVPVYIPFWLPGDGNSISADPGFVNTLISGAGGTPDLHIGPNPTPVANAGIPVTTVSNDFDGNARDLNNPDIGAHEGAFIPATILNITSVVADPPIPQCTPTDRNITAEVNAGGVPVTAVTLYYSYDGVPQTPISMTGGPTTWMAVLPASSPNQLVEWSVGATDGSTYVGMVGASYKDESPIVFASADKDTVCSGEQVSLLGTSEFVLGSGSQVTQAATGTVAQISPFMHYYGNARTQYLIKAAELQALGMSAGNITSIAMDVVGIGSNITMQNVSISIAPTTLIDLSASYENSGLIDVFGPQNVTPTVGINRFDFHTPYMWDGISDIVVQFCYRNGNTGNGSNAYTVRFDPTTYVSNRISRSDNSQPNMCSVISGSSNGTNSGRPMFIFRSTGNSFDWLWSPSGATTSTDVATPVNTSSAPVVETYYVTATNPISGCSTSVSVDVVVQNIPDMPLVTSSTQCGTGIPTATATAVGPGIIMWYDQQTGGNNIQSGGNTYTNPITTTTTFYVSELDGSCESERVSLTATVSIPDPVEATTAMTTICPNTTITLEAAQMGTSQVYTYTWTVDPEPGSGIIGSVTGAQPSITPTDPGVYTYFLEATDATGPSVCIAYDTLEITVVKNPEVEIAMSEDTACSGAEIVLTARAKYTFGDGASTSPTGTGINAQISPFLHYYGNARTQYLIRADELSVAGLSAGENLSSIAIDIVNVGANITMQNVSINLALTTLSDLSSSFENTGLIQVYDNAALVPTAGINTFNFTTPFVWDGTSNLIVQFCYRNNNNGNGNTAYTVKYDPTSYVSNRFYRADGTQTGICTSTTMSGTNSARPQFIFTTTGSPIDWVWSPTGATTEDNIITPVNTTGSILLDNHSVTGTHQITGCSATASVDIAVKPAPDQPMVTSSVQCGTAIPTATATPVGPGIILWYDQATGGTVLQTGGSSFANPISTTTTFYVAELDGTCEGARTPVTASVTTPDPVEASPDGINICPGSTFTIEATQIGTTQNYTYSWTAIPEIGSGMSGSMPGQTFPVTPTNPGTYAYTVTAVDGACITYDTIHVTVDLVPDVYITPVSGNVSFCGANPIFLSASTENVLFSEDFDGATYDMVSENYSTGTNPPNAEWTVRADGYVYNTGVTNYTFNTPTATQFILTNSDAVGSGASVDTRITSPVLNTSGFATMSLSFSHHFKARLSSTAYVEVTTDGTTWTSVASYTGTDEGAPDNFVSETIDLTAYTNNPEFQFRFRFAAGWDWWWAIDDVVLKGLVEGLDVAWNATPLNDAGLPPNSGIADPTNQTIGVTPVPGATYTYTATVYTAASCPSIGDATLNIVQNPIAGLAPNGSNASITHIPGVTYQYTDASCNLITEIATTTTSSLGNVNVSVTVEPTVPMVGGNPYLQRHYQITSNTSAPATVTLYATQAEFDAYNSVATSLPPLPTGGVDNGNVMVSKFPTSSFSSGTGELITPTSVIWNAANNWWEITIEVNSFSKFYIHTGTSGPLFVKLESIKATNVGKRNRVDWITAQEKDVVSFDVERSIDGKNFQLLGSVEAKQTASNYTFWDEQPIEGINYYRLRIHNNTGEVEFSHIVQAYVAASGTFTVQAFPNPVSDNLTVKALGSQGMNPKVAITDATGKVLQQLTMEGNSINIPMANMPSGIYFIHYSDDMHTHSLKVTKQ